MAYVDGFLVPVPTTSKADYRALAERMAPLFREHGATRMVEGWGDDVPDGKLTDFPMAVKLQPGETVVFSWIEWPSKTVRDAGMAKIMADPRMQPGEDMVFDGKRMVFGGFEVLFEG